MRVPLSWLAEFVSLKETPEALAEKLQLSGTSVDTIEKVDNQVIFVTEITTNRPDCLSIFGIAQEVASLTNQKAVRPNYSIPQIDNPWVEISIVVKPTTLCPVYSSLVFDNVKIGPSPSFIVDRLKQVGVRSLNNIIDITNYLMFAYGLPMHAFDYDKIAQGRIIIRESREGEKVVTLDKKERKLPAGSTIIEDSRKIIDLAGIMGGAESEIDQNTKRVFLHVPVYDPVAIRRTSRYLGLRTEASNRYEKKLDLLATNYSLAAAVRLIEQFAKGKVASNVYSLRIPGYQPPTITIRGDDVLKVIGISIPQEKVIHTLLSLGFKVKKKGEEYTLTVVPPSSRRDVQAAEDVVEEIGRIYGYNKLPLTLPQGGLPTHEDSFQTDWLKIAKNLLAGLGFTEVYSSTLVTGEILKLTNLSLDHMLKVLHPMSSDYEYLRPTLIPGLIQLVKKNLYFRKEVSLFELGTVFPQGKKQQSLVAAGKIPHQPQLLALVTTQGDFFTLKGRLEFLLLSLGIDSQFTSTTQGMPAYFQAKQTAKIGSLGFLGLINPKIAANFGIDKPVWALEMSFEPVCQLAERDLSYPTIPKYPATIEDLTFLFTGQPKVGKIMAAIKSVSLRIAKVEYLGRFQNSISFRLHYQDQQKTLVAKEVSGLREKIVTQVENNFAAQLKRAKKI